VKIMSLAPAEMKSSIQIWCGEAGFDASAVTSADEVVGNREALAKCLENGYHGSMAWMEDRTEQRIALSALWPEAKSAIICAMNYGPDGDPMLLRDQPDRGAISVYARNKDYHDLVKSRLKQVARRIHGDLNAEVKVFVDTAPVMEKPLAQQAGLGWVGKHSNVVFRRFGSWMFLGVIATTLELPVDAAHENRCGRCQKCKVACPTAAIVSDGVVDARRCLSYLTIEHKGPIPEEFRKAMGNRIYGCDDCLSVCPWNRFAQVARETKLQAREDLKSPHLHELVGLDDAAFRILFSGSPIKRIGRVRFIRNVLIAIGNTGDEAYGESVRGLLDDADFIVRDAADWALKQITPKMEFPE